MSLDRSPGEPSGRVPVPTYYVAVVSVGPRGGWDFEAFEDLHPPAPAGVVHVGVQNDKGHSITGKVRLHTPGAQAASNCYRHLSQFGRGSQEEGHFGCLNFVYRPNVLAPVTPYGNRLITGGQSGTTTIWWAKPPGLSVVLLINWRYRSPSTKMPFSRERRSSRCCGRL